MMGNYWKTFEKMTEFKTWIMIYFTGGHRTRVAAFTLDNMAEDAVAASVNLRQILTMSVRFCGPTLWVDCQCYGTHWRGIPSCSDSVSRHNSGLKFHVATRVSVMSVFPGRGCRSALTRVPLCTDERRASSILRTAGQLGTVYIFLDKKSHLSFLPYLDMIQVVWSQL